jgi:hypothetical protein
MNDNDRQNQNPARPAPGAGKQSGVEDPGKTPKQAEGERETADRGADRAAERPRTGQGGQTSR